MRSASINQYNDRTQTKLMQAYHDEQVSPTLSLPWFFLRPCPPGEGVPVLLYRIEIALGYVDAWDVVGDVQVNYLLS